MKTVVFLSIVIISLFIFTADLSAQTYIPKNDSLHILYKAGIYKPISAEDSIMLTNLPVLELPEHYKDSRAPLLPSVLDNSTQPYFRPPFNQAGYACGQAALVGYNFTYEINYKRNLPGNDPDNQYPTHFVWNWMNAANNYGGVSYYHTMEVLRHVGTPTVTEYGGMSEGGPKRWMTGYEDYYSAMHNRITQAYNIRTDTYEGFMTLKYWLFDHLDGSPAGGLASFYANQPYMYTLPLGTPEAGKHVCIGWASSSSHALTIVGWNDSICWDYNNDGQYTNDVDINGDGIINIKDWEIGGFKFVNSYGGVPGWGDGGFCYMMYKTVADKFGQGGYWNSTSNVLKVKEDCSPQITYKVKIKYTCRKQLKVTAGISFDTTATEPDHELAFPIFNYQGACWYMLGGDTPEDKTIEFGLDVTPLLNYLLPGQPAKFFLQVQEDETTEWGEGEVKNFSLIDYTNGVQEIICSDSNINIPDDGLVSMSVISTINYNDVVITTNELAPAPIYEPYSFQLMASGGTPPYTWKYFIEYDETNYTQSFPMITNEQLSPTNNWSGYALKNLEFEFPFYGQSYDTVYIFTDGFLKFDNYPVTWPYHHDTYLRFIKNKNIAPFFDIGLRIYPAEGDGLWYEGDENGATFRWKVSQDGASGADLNLALKLYPSGNIEFYYGSVILSQPTEWYAGTTNGDGINYQQSGISNDTNIVENSMIEFLAPSLPVEMEVAEDGIFSGTPTHEYNDLEVAFLATDNNNISSSKTLLFNTIGVLTEIAVTAGTNDTIEYGETAYLDVTLKNIGSQALHNTEMSLTTSDNYTTLIDSLAFFGTLEPDQPVVVNEAFSFNVADTVPNEHQILMNSIISSDEYNFEKEFLFTAYAPVLNAGNVVVDDGNNGWLDPGETTDLIVTINNQGGASVQNVYGLLSSTDPSITINNGLDSLSLIPGYAQGNLTFNITVSPQALEGHIAYFELIIAPENYTSTIDSVYLTVGVIVEDFETGDFLNFPWYFDGDADWLITTNNPYEGTNCSRSGGIDHNEESALKLDINVLSDAEISFYKKVSSEANYDYLRFYIDASEKDKWAGEVSWSKKTYSISKGQHTLKWVYKKDYSVSNGSDRAWLDYIILPPIESLLLMVNAGQDDTICEGNTVALSGSVYNADSILWITSGTGTFNNDTILDPVYTPSSLDIINGTVTLGLKVYGSQGQTLTDYLTITINRFPLSDAGNDTITCENSPVVLSGTVVFSDSAYWTTGGDGYFDDSTSLSPAYYAGPADISAGSVNLYLTAYPKAPCLDTDTDTLMLTVANLPLAFAGEDGAVCENGSYQLSGSMENATASLWSTLGDGTFDDPLSLSAMYTPGEEDISAGFAELTLTAFAYEPCNDVHTDTMIITVMEPPLAYAGEDQTIEYNTTTTLNGSAEGGSGDYSWYWTPETYLVDPTIQNPETFPLTSNTTFNLLVTDLSSGCQDDDDVEVTITGSPFTIAVTADPENVCMGDPTQLNVEAEGTTGPFTYSWTSDPQGFTSDLPNPIDTPLVNTTYYIVVTDNFYNQVDGFVSVDVTTPPEAYAGADTNICENETITLNGYAVNFSSVIWLTTGDGFFDDTTVLNPTYTPGENDILYGNVELSLIANGTPPCNTPVVDQLILILDPLPDVTFDLLPDFCIDDPPYLLTEGEPDGGEYAGNGVIDGYFYPEVAGLGYHTISYTYTNENGCVNTAFQEAYVDLCARIDRNDPEFKATIIPNPNDGYYILELFSAKASVDEIRIINQEGREIYNQFHNLQQGNNRISMDMNGQPSGIYILLIKHQEKEFVKKIIIF
ncbi:MAG: T9SS type A sorting domain-containing protein [Bacteroidales bacterium]|nr:T9SS type A sorting domain-containing protein [Bacteroidales bacterium]